MNKITKEQFEEALETLEAFDLEVMSWKAAYKDNETNLKNKNFFHVVKAWHELPITDAIQTIRAALQTLPAVDVEQFKLKLSTNGSIVKSAELSTEELAELHAIIQAIMYEREQDAHTKI